MKRVAALRSLGPARAYDGVGQISRPVGFKDQIHPRSEFLYRARHQLEHGSRHGHAVRANVARMHDASAEILGVSDVQASGFDCQFILLPRPELRTQKSWRYCGDSGVVHRACPGCQQELTAGPQGTRYIAEESGLVLKMLGRFHHPYHIECAGRKRKSVSIADYKAQPVSETCPGSILLCDPRLLWADRHARATATKLLRQIDERAAVPAADVEYFFSAMRSKNFHAMRKHLHLRFSRRFSVPE